MFTPQDDNENIPTNALQQEQMRRQQMLRLGLIICLLFLLLDGGGNQDNSKNVSGDYNGKNRGSFASTADIPLSDPLGQKMKSVLEADNKATLFGTIATSASIGSSKLESYFDLSKFTGPPINVTGFYRGIWRFRASETTTTIPGIGRKPPPSNGGSGGSSNMTETERNKLTVNKVLSGGGTALIQLVSVPVRGVADLNFVYGVLRLYRSNSMRGPAAAATA
eukprot:CAMPEP_0174996702 /NCGR_PEP_ID=MMETSP0005-20121125/543_1 /TAXON_ID=420556 /ORGANISM="Ochromonas sp., Strain CCMP1393" /LENGTH=221 /DNA_ID=CAMNT_0016251143 /DNA_START=65 /DNA_END=726 /DNA_ORIENTATION=+